MSSFQEMFKFRSYLQRLFISIRERNRSQHQEKEAVLKLNQTSFQQVACSIRTQIPGFSNKQKVQIKDAFVWFRGIFLAFSYFEMTSFISSRNVTIFQAYTHGHL